MSAYTSVLARLPGLERMSRQSIEALARYGEVVDVAAGDVVIPVDDRWSGAYVIMAGEVEVRADGWTAVVGPGTRIGRDGAGRLGFVAVARTSVRLLAVDRRAVAVRELLAAS